MLNQKLLMSCWRVGGVALAALLISPAAAQDPVRQLQDCRVIQNMASRLFCYDRVVDGLTAASVVGVAPPAAPAVAPPAPAIVPPVTSAMPPRVPSAVAAPATPAAVRQPTAPTPIPQPAPQTAPPARAAAVPQPPASSATDRFGAESVDAKKRRAQTQSDPDQMYAKISQVKKNRYGDAVVTLDNGQVWRQTEGNTLNAPAGTDIVIKKGVLGSYFLTLVDSNRSVRVKRVE